MGSAFSRSSPEFGRNVGLLAGGCLLVGAGVAIAVYYATRSKSSNGGVGNDCTRPELVSRTAVVGKGNITVPIGNDKFQGMLIGSFDDSGLPVGYTNVTPMKFNGTDFEEFGETKSNILDDSDLVFQTMWNGGTHVVFFGTSRTLDTMTVKSVDLATANDSTDFWSLPSVTKSWSVVANSFCANTLWDEEKKRLIIAITGGTDVVLHELDYANLPDSVPPSFHTFANSANGFPPLVSIVRDTFFAIMSDTSVIRFCTFGRDGKNGNWAQRGCVDVPQTNPAKNPITSAVSYDELTVVTSNTSGTGSSIDVEVRTRANKTDAFPSAPARKITFSDSDFVASGKGLEFFGTGATFIMYNTSVDEKINLGAYNAANSEKLNNFDVEFTTEPGPEAGGILQTLQFRTKSLFLGNDSYIVPVMSAVPGVDRVDFAIVKCSGGKSKSSTVVPAATSQSFAASTASSSSGRKCCGRS